MVAQVTKFQTADGKTFDKLSEARAHELKCELEVMIAARFNDDDFYQPPPRYVSGVVLREISMSPEIQSKMKEWLKLLEDPDG